MSLARVRPGELEPGPEEPVQVGGPAADGLQGLATRGLGQALLIEEQAGEADHRGQRGAELVAHRGHQVGAQPLELALAALVTEQEQPPRSPAAARLDAGTTREEELAGAALEGALPRARALRAPQPAALEGRLQVDALQPAPGRAQHASCRGVHAQDPLVAVEEQDALAQASHQRAELVARLPELGVPGAQVPREREALASRASRVQARRSRAEGSELEPRSRPYSRMRR